MTGDQVLYDVAMSFLHQPYRWGGDDPIVGFDCSGLVQEILKSAGIAPPEDKTAQGLFDYFRNSARWSYTKLGSLVFYGRTQAEITNVAFALNTYYCLEAGGGGSKTTSKDAASEQNAFVRVRPIARRADQVAVLYPFYKHVG